MPAAVIILGCLVTTVLLRYLSTRRKANAPLPPGPRGLPLLGNIRDLPSSEEPECLHWLKHKDIYGPISSVTVLGQTMVLLHDRKMAMELLEKRAAIHSGRPSLKFGLEMVGWNETLGSVPNNAIHRVYRKYAYKQLGSKAAVSRYHGMQEMIVGQTLRRLKRTEGKNLAYDLKMQTGGLILRVLYDYKLDPHNPDPLVDLANITMDQFSQATVPGRWLVDIIPILAHIPEWFPGASFKKTARLWKNTLRKSVNVPYSFAKERKRNESNGISFVSRAIDQAEAENEGSALTEEQEYAIKWSAVSMYIGGEDTSAITLNAFFLAMSMFPEVQRKAQEEIDSVVGTQRLPTFSDREQMPYINAIVEEALRWHPITPTILPHGADKEDEICGYRIPKGSVLIPNVWWFTRDPEVYHDPETFKPERYLEPYNEPSPRDMVFGYGRRICPGRLFAETSLYLSFAQILSVFDIRPATNQYGEEIENTHTMGLGIVAKTGPFEVRVRPRSEAHGAIIEQLSEKYPWEDSDARYLDGLLNDL